MIAVFAISTPDESRATRLPFSRMAAEQLPLHNGRSGNQQHKQDRYYQRRYEPVANIEFACIGHLTAFLRSRRERNALSHR